MQSRPMSLGDRAALLVVDIQQGGAAPPTESGIEVMDGYADMAADGRRPRRGRPPLRIPVIFIQELHRPNGVDFGRELDGAEGVHCVEGRPGTELWPTLRPGAADYYVPKRRYSAFFGTDIGHPAQRFGRRHPDPDRQSHRCVRPLHVRRRPPKGFLCPGRGGLRDRVDRGPPRSFARRHGVLCSTGPAARPTASWPRSTPVPSPPPQPEESIDAQPDLPPAPGVAAGARHRRCRLGADRLRLVGFPAGGWRHGRDHRRRRPCIRPATR